MTNSSEIKTSRIVKCPRCGQSTRYDESNEFRPFCSDRCKVIDAGSWADEEYRVPVVEAPDEFLPDSEE